ncbi:MAG: stage II sporulation protein P [Candidatus Gastranaerophilales bacterium]|nr:stage II sporulation protein P [Candidatus Gastranaerophilales bacterium]
MYLAVFAAGMLFLFSVGKSLILSEDTLGTAAKKALAREWCNALYEQFLPVVSLIREEPTFLKSQIIEVMPLYGYAQEQAQIMEDPHSEESLYGELFHGESSPGEAAESGEFLLLGRGDDEAKENLEISDEERRESLEALLRAENEAAQMAMEEQTRGTFIPHEAQNVIDLEELADYETLIGRFYTIDGNTMAGSDQLDVEKLLSYDMSIEKTGEVPQILIYHTHSQEAFADSVPGDESTTIVGVGELLAQILRERYGYQVLHHTGRYDVDSRDDAYAEALPDLEQVLLANPSIQVVIDLHRDEMPEDTRLVADLDGRPTARFMFFNGLSRTKKTGDISYLENVYQQENLAFSFQMQLAAQTYYPGMARKIYLKGYRYNLHLCPRSILIEVGAQNNTLEEMRNACDPIAHILDLVLSGQ